MSTLLFLMATLAVARATRAVTTDEVGAPARRALARRFPPLNAPLWREETGQPIPNTGQLTPRWPVRFVNCDWCVAFWLALALALALQAWLSLGWGETVVNWWAMAAGAPMLLSLARR